MKPIDCTRIKRILVTRTDRIGDAVLSTPVFQAIKVQYPSCHLAAMVFKETAPLVLGHPSVDQVIIYDKKGIHAGWWATVLFALKLRKERFDLIIHLHPTNRVHFISWFAGIPVRIGYQSSNHLFLTHTIEEKKWQGRRHEAEYNFDLLNFIHISTPQILSLYVPLHSADKEELEGLLPKQPSNRYVVFHPSASCVSKRWAPDRLAQVADRLVRVYQITPVIVGEDLGMAHAVHMQEFMKEKSLNLAGKLSLGMLTWLLKGARLLISNDSGPVHIAAALGTPVISIFGRNQAGLSPLRWRPISANSSFVQKDVGCVECLAHHCQIDFKCLKELTVEDVFEEAKQYESFLV
jgi:heptosyltransferase II